VTALMLEWTGPEGGTIGVDFDDGHFGTERMRAEIDLARRAYPSLPDEVPPGTRFSFGKEATGHLAARFRVGGTVYRGGGREGELHGLWDALGMIYGLLHPERQKAAS
jgi:hypothetical protein